MIGTRAALLVGMVGVAAAALAAPASAAPAPSPGAAASGTADWKLIYQTDQTTYYLNAAGSAPTGDFNVQTLLEFKVPQVVDGAQVWSMVTHMQVNCRSQQLMTSENTFYASQMGSGKAIQTQAASDNWHDPDPGSLGELVLSTSCGKS
jgi:surface-adhesin protein E